MESPTFDPAASQQDTPAAQLSLGLTQQQVQVISAHLNDAAGKLLNFRFDGGEDHTAVALRAHSFEVGRFQAFKALLDYDRELLAQQAELVNKLKEQMSQQQPQPE